jgi:flagellin
MGFQINTNIPSLMAQDNLRLTSDFQQKTISRVTSGLRITSSGDDAAGLAIANGFRSDIAVLSQGIRNANDGLSTLQIIDGGINNISKLLDRARTLATQSASGTYTGSRSVLNSEFQSVLGEINRQAQAIGLDRGGQFAKSLSVFIGGGKANGTSEITNGSIGVDLRASTVDAQSLGLSGVQAVSATGTDLSTSSATTNVQSIVTDTTNKNSVATAGYSDFFFRGAGFSDNDRVKVSVNLSGVTDTSTLVSAINTAIDAAGNGSTSAATAFKNANIRAVVVTDTQADGTIK